MSLLASLRAVPGKINNEFANPDSVMRSQLRGAAASAAASAAGAAEAAADSVVVARRELGDATVAVGSLVARLATSVSGALRDGEFSAAGGGLLGSVVGAPGGVSAKKAAAAAAAAAAAEEDEEDDEEGADAHGGLGRALRLPRFLRPAHGAVVLFVGGGPVGLWTALQLKLLRPLWRVAVAERHARYVRAHVLRVSAQSFERVVPHLEARAFVARLLGGRPAVAVRTTELERALRALAQGVGVEVLAGEAVRALPLGVAGGGAWLAPPPPTTTVVAPAAAPEAQPKAGPAELNGGSRAEGAAPAADAVLVVAAGAAAGSGSGLLHSERLQSLLTSASVIVGCDGARSLCRRVLFGTGGNGGLRDSQSLAHMVHVRYEACGPTSRLSVLAAAGLFSAMGFVGEEHVGRPRGSPVVTPCTLTLVADEAALGAMVRGGGGGAAVPLEDAPWAPRLRDAVRLWLNAKAELVGEVRVAGSETVTAVRLSVYRAGGFVTYASRVAAEAAAAAAAAATAGATTAEAGPDAAPVLCDAPPPPPPEGAAPDNAVAAPGPQQQLQQALCRPPTWRLRSSATPRLACPTTARSTTGSCAGPSSRRRSASTAARPAMHGAVAATAAAARAHHRSRATRAPSSGWRRRRSPPRASRPRRSRSPAPARLLRTRCRPARRSCTTPRGSSAGGARRCSPRWRRRRPQQQGCCL